jgi:SAM-dependent methyltransferase
MSGVRPSVRLPRRIVPIWVSDPMGLARPFRIAITPAMVVVLTAPRPTSKMPSLPPAGSMDRPLVTGENYIIRIETMLKRLFKARTLPNAPLAMVGAKAGDRVLVVGARHPDVAAELARVTGLNGQTVVVGTESDRAVMEAAAADAGALIDFQPQEAGAIARHDNPFDVVVAMRPLAGLSDADRTRFITDVFAAVRPGGRVIVIDGGSSPGLLWRVPTQAVDSPMVLKLLTAAGGLAVRTLGTINHLTYHEARKNR